MRGCLPPALPLVALLLAACPSEAPDQRPTSPPADAAPQAPPAGPVELSWAQDEVGAISDPTYSMDGRFRLAPQALRPVVRWAGGEACLETLSKDLCEHLGGSPIRCHEAAGRSLELFISSDLDTARLAAEVAVNRSTMTFSSSYRLEGVSPAMCAGEAEHATALVAALATDWLERLDKSLEVRTRKLPNEVLEAREIPASEGHPSGRARVDVGHAEAFADRLWLVRSYGDGVVVHVVDPRGSVRSAWFGTGAGIKTDRTPLVTPDPARERLLLTVDRFVPPQGAKTKAGAVVVAVDQQGRAALVAQVPGAMKLGRALVDSEGAILLPAGEVDEHLYKLAGSGERLERWAVDTPDAAGTPHLMWLSPSVIGMLGRDELVAYDLSGEAPGRRTLWSWKLAEVAAVVPDGAGGAYVLQVSERGRAKVASLHHVGPDGATRWSTRWEDQLPSRLYALDGEGAPLLASGDVFTHRIDPASGQKLATDPYGVSGRPAAASGGFVACALPKLPLTEPRGQGELRRLDAAGAPAGAPISLPLACSHALAIGDEVLASSGARGFYRIKP